MINYERHLSQKSNQKKLKKTIITTYLISCVSISLLIVIFMGKSFNFIDYNKQFNELRIGGIPSAIILDVFSDSEALNAFFFGDRMALRSRLKELNIDKKMMELYRPYFSNEIELERYVDQIFYNDTGYANPKEYSIDKKGNLIRKKPFESNSPTNSPNNNPETKGLFDFIKPRSP